MPGGAPIFPEAPPGGEKPLEAFAAAPPPARNRKPARPAWLTQILTRNEEKSPPSTPKSDKVLWQWEHRTGFRDYDATVVLRIEQAYLKGDAYVRMKSGKGGGVPMEIFYADMLQYDPVSGNTRRVRRLGPNGLNVRAWRYAAEVAHSVQTGKPRKMMFAQYEQDRQALFQGGGESESVSVQKDLYKTRGCWQLVARSVVFFVCSMLVVILNVVWMFIDAEFNDAASISTAALHFQVAENLFCGFFTLELFIRFCAFKSTGCCLKDKWFMFDAVLVATQILETWLMPLILAGKQPTELAFLQVTRLLRLARLGRLMRMLRLFPDVLALLKGIAMAMRPVTYVLLVLVVLLFVFAFVFKTLASDSEELTALFPSLIDTMGMLLFCGTLLDGPTTTFFNIWHNSMPLAMLFLVFIFLSSLTLLNMLIGILCDVVFEVSKMEKDDAALALLKNTMVNLLECYDKNDDKTIGIDEFDLFMANPETRKILRRFDVDASGLLSLRDVLFEQKGGEMSPRSKAPSGDSAPSPSSPKRIVSSQSSKTAVSLPSSSADDALSSKKLTFVEILEVILRLRGGKTCTVTDMMELREYVKQRVDGAEQQLSDHGRRLDEIQATLLEMSRAIHSVEAHLQSQGGELSELV